jgi:WS/DGAT/MGAT family acyltransferase
MSDTFSERLSAMDAMFLEIEDANVHMHVGAVAIFEAAPLRGPGGGLDLDLVLRFAEAQLHKRPRMRQKLVTIPWFDRPVWVDDAHFNLAYHVRHSALPPPGDVRQLKRMVGRILSQALDRSKPLWEMWIVEGIEGDRFAVVSKLHHCMADGATGADLAGLLTGTEPRQTPNPGPPWRPRPAPEGAQLIRSELVRRVTAPLSLLRGSAGAEAEQKSGGLSESLGRLAQIVRGATRAAEAGLQPASDTSLNVEVGPHRRFDWVGLDLLAIKRLGHAAGGKLNDAVLALVTGALRSSLLRRGEDPDELIFRVAVPVDVRTEADRDKPGNRVSSLIVELPVAEAEPWQRLRRIVATTSELKDSGESQAVDLLGRLAEWLPAGAMAGISRVGNRAVNMIVTNVPGPRVPIYMLTARLLESYPYAPLMANQALNIALYSYQDDLFVGFLADWDALPDLHDFVEDVPAELEALAKAALAAGHVEALADERDGG